MTRFATRLNSFAARAEVEWPDRDGKPTAMMTARRASRVEGVRAACLVLQNEVAEAVNLTAAQSARDRDLRVCLNAAQWRAMSDRLLGLVDILVMNALEAEALCGIAVDGLTSARAAAIRLAQRFPLAVVTARGARRRAGRWGDGSRAAGWRSRKI